MLIIHTKLCVPKKTQREEISKKKREETWTSGCRSTVCWRYKLVTIYSFPSVLLHDNSLKFENHNTIRSTMPSFTLRSTTKIFCNILTITCLLSMKDDVSPFPRHSGPTPPDTSPSHHPFSYSIKHYAHKVSYRSFHSLEIQRYLLFFCISLIERQSVYLLVVQSLISF